MDGPIPTRSAAGSQPNVSRSRVTVRAAIPAPSAPTRVGDGDDLTVGRVEKQGDAVSKAQEQHQAGRVAGQAIGGGDSVPGVGGTDHGDAIAVYLLRGDETLWHGAHGTQRSVEVAADRPGSVANGAAHVEGVVRWLAHAALPRQNRLDHPPARQRSKSIVGRLPAMNHTLHCRSSLAPWKSLWRY